MSQNSGTDFTAYDNYIDQHFDAMVVELREFCAKPTLAGQRIGLTEGVQAVRALVEPLGARVQEVPLEGGAPPVVLAELGQGERTLLLYNHYDVQPPEPLDLWETPPYSGDIRGGKFYARGVADDRGDLLSRVLAIRAYQATIGEVPLRLRWLIEGEEEIGSPHLAPVVQAHAAELQADWCAWEGSMHDDMDLPHVTCGAKGMLYVEMHSTGPSHDAHSANGGILPNPAWRLVTALSTLRDAKGNFTMDGLDELVAVPSDMDKRAVEAMPFDVEARRAIFGIKGWQRGLQGRDVLYTELFEPTANIAGFYSGYSGEGSKTIVPSKATVKMDFRLVPNQTPQRMLELLRVHLARRGFDDIEIKVLGELEVARTPVDNPVVKASVAAWEDMGVQRVVLSPTMAGSGPMSLITANLGIPTVMTGGVAYIDSRIHSPNEHIKLEHLRSGIRYWGRFFSRLAQ